MVNRKVALISFGIMSLIGIALSSVAYHLWSESHRLKAEGVETTGTVVGHRSNDYYSRSQSQSRRRQQKRTVAAVVEFVDTEGMRQTATSDVYTSPPRFRTGEQVKLWYAPHKPEQILIAGGAEEWLLTLILGGLGGLLMLAGIPNFFKATKLYTGTRPA